MSGRDRATERQVRLSCRGAESTAVLRWWQDGPYDYGVALDGPAGEVVGRGPDLFEALVEVRRQLEPVGCLVAVQGARRDTYPSGMARDMGGGAQVYVLRPGKPARERVGTFDDAPVALLGTVEQQRRHFEACLERR
jgi:hypothetical protein